MEYVLVFMFSITPISIDRFYKDRETCEEVAKEFMKNNYNTVFKCMRIKRK